MSSSSLRVVDGEGTTFRRRAGRRTRVCTHVPRGRACSLRCRPHRSSARHHPARWPGVKTRGRRTELRGGGGFIFRGGGPPIFWPSPSRETRITTTPSRATPPRPPTSTMQLSPWTKILKKTDGPTTPPTSSTSLTMNVDLLRGRQDKDDRARDHGQRDDRERDVAVRWVLPMRAQQERME